MSRTTRTLLRGRVRTPGLEAAILWGAILLFSLFKMRGYGMHGRFWAEEGRFFYSDIASQSGAQGLLYLFNHHLELMTNLVVWCSTLVELYHAPLVTTWFSWLLQLLPIGLVIHCRRQIGLSFGRTLLFILAAAALPQSREVWANSINLHFHFALLAGIIAVVPPRSGPQAWLFRILLLLAGLSGIPANSLFPLFVLIAIRSRLRERWIQSAILAVTIAVQAVLLLQHGLAVDGRDAATAPLVLWLAMLSQHVVSPLLGIKVAGEVIGQFNLLATEAPSAWVLAMAITVSYVLLWVRVWKRRLMTSVTCLGGALLLAVFCVLTSLGSRTVFVSVDTGGRYFFASNLLLALGILLSIPSATSRTWRTMLTLWALLSLPGLRSTFSGPAWPEAYHRAQRERADEIAIWPRGWTMRNPGAGLAVPLRPNDEATPGLPEQTPRAD